MSGLILTFNTGSSTVKIGAFEQQGTAFHKSARAGIDFSASPLNFHLEHRTNRLDIALQAQAHDDIVMIMGEVFEKLSPHMDLSRITAIGHRIVHGGDLFAGPVKIDDQVIAAIDQLAVFAPLHQPKSLALIRAARRLFPQIPQSASFDTAFHRTMPEIVRRFAIPRAMHEQGIKRYGFHGLSYQSVINDFADREPALSKGKVIIAHLGSGASLCALAEGKSVDTSMSFSTLDGIPMATRCGNIDAGVLLHLLTQQNISNDALTDLLYHQCGLLGVSGISGDCRELINNSAAPAIEAIELFTLRIAGEICRLASVLGGFDALIFTAGIGEHQPAVRAAICRKLSWLGAKIDEKANHAGAFRITTPASRIAAFILATDEERIIAQDTCKILNISPQPISSQQVKDFRNE